MYDFIQRELECKTCGAKLIKQDDAYYCPYCGNRWEHNSENDIYAVTKANAWMALRLGNFEDAQRLFENILNSSPKSHEAYWGRALSIFRITYVDDFGKKIPTCNNISEESFTANSDVKKAISYAGSEIAEAYKAQAKEIDRISAEWIKIAKKEPEYDVFISYKDSDQENNIERTQDSVDAQDLYHLLTEEGYKVFFSRISLKKVSGSMYEPYIYNAIKTAKVMIVFGEKAEYFNATWVKNEWSRFKKRIDNNEKSHDSLIVVMKKMNQSELPVDLRSRQYINLDETGAEITLLKYLKDAIDKKKKTPPKEEIIPEPKPPKVKKESKLPIWKNKIIRFFLQYVYSNKMTKKQKGIRILVSVALVIFIGMFAFLPGIKEEFPLIPGVSNVLNIKEYDVPEGTTEISSAQFKGFKTLETVRIPDSVTKIGSEAFSGCTSLKNVVIGENSSITEIADSAFYNCTSLTNIDLPDSVTTIKEGAFKDCSDLQKFRVPQNLKAVHNNAFLGCDSLSEVSVSNWKKWYEIDFVTASSNPLKYADEFYVNSELVDKIVVPDSITAVPRNVFAGLKTITDVTIHNGVTNIGIGAFDGCVNIKNVHISDLSNWCNIEFSDKLSNPLYYADGLYLNDELVTDVVLPDQIDTVKAYTFAGYDNLKSLVIPKSVTSINCGTLVDCNGIISLTLPFIGASENDTSTGVISYIFGSGSNDSNDKVVPKSLQKVEVTGGGSLASYSFSNCSGLKEVILSNDITEINSFAFYGCTSLESITVPFVGRYHGAEKGEMHFGYIFGYTETLDAPEKFHYCYMASANYRNYWHYFSYYIPKSLKQVKINDVSVTDNAFVKCDTIENIIIVDGVTSIGSSAFSECTALTSITIPSSVKTINTSAFYGCEQLTDVIFAEKSKLNTIYESAFELCTSIKSITIPNSVTSIGSGAFSNCTSLETISLPFIGGGDGSGSAAHHFGFIFGYDESYNVISGWQYAYSTKYDTYYCKYYIPSSLKNVIVTGEITSVGDYVFRGCKNLESIILPSSVVSIGNGAFYECTNLLSVSIPDAVTGIAAEAFYNCGNLQTILLPSNLQNIGQNAFYGCDQLLEKENYISYLGNWVISCTYPITELTLRDGTVGIAGYAFNNIDSLVTVVIPSGVKYISDGAFYDCDGLRELRISDGVVVIGYAAFYSCSNLEKAYIPASVMEIGSIAFDTGNTSTTIYCAVTSAPPRWGSNWCSWYIDTKIYSCNVVYGYVE